MEYPCQEQRNSYRRSENALLGGSLFAMLSLAIGLIATSPAKAADDVTDAQKIRQIDIMLMVTSLRCRFESNDFRTEYQDFQASHEPEIHFANNRIKADFRKYEANGIAQKSFDSLITKMANRFGNGHPWLGCAELKSVTSTLAKMQGRGPIIEAYSQLVAGEQRMSQIAVADFPVQSPSIAQAAK